MEGVPLLVPNSFTSWCSPTSSGPTGSASSGVTRRVAPSPIAAVPAARGGERRLRRHIFATWIAEHPV